MSNNPTDIKLFVFVRLLRHIGILVVLLGFIAGAIGLMVDQTSSHTDIPFPRPPVSDPVINAPVTSTIVDPIFIPMDNTLKE